VEGVTELVHTHNVCMISLGADKKTKNMSRSSRCYIPLGAGVLHLQFMRVVPRLEYPLPDG
jgi:hypothetical protein